MIEIESSEHEIEQEFEPLLNADPEISYNNFFKECLIKNRPCIFQSKLTDDWESRKKWVSNGAPNFEFLCTQFGSCEGPVANCQQFYSNRQVRKTMSINEYITYWIDLKKNNNEDLLYLKDWHCVKQSKNSSFYTVPKFFASDWLNEYCLGKNIDDYLFVYAGPKGSWTPFHEDVLTSFSWSANVCGRKKWIFVPPGQESISLHKRDSTHKPFDDVNDLNNFNQKSVKSFQIIQEPGQVVFVPSGWYHQVFNLEDTISINHNWINGCNIFQVWSRLKLDLLSVIKEIRDCEEMDNWKKHCQLILKASFGLDYPEFLDILEFIAERRLKSILTENSKIINFKWEQGLNHTLFDLKQLLNVLEDYTKEIFDKSLNDICSLNRVKDLFSRIKAAISN